MTDEEMLAEVLTERYSERVSTKEAKAFQDMLERDKPLTEKQREWLHNVADRLGVRAFAKGVRNLFSALPEEEQKEHLARAAAIKLPWERGAPRPLKPPGRA